MKLEPPFPGLVLHKLTKQEIIDYNHEYERGMHIWFVYYEGKRIAVREIAQIDGKSVAYRIDVDYKWTHKGIGSWLLLSTLDYHTHVYIPNENAEGLYKACGLKLRQDTGTLWKVC